MRQLFERVAGRVELDGGFEVGQGLLGEAGLAAQVGALQQGAGAGVAEADGFAVHELGLAWVAHAFADRAEVQVGVAQGAVDGEGGGVFAQRLRDVVALLVHEGAFVVAEREATGPGLLRALRERGQAGRQPDGQCG